MRKFICWFAMVIILGLASEVGAQSASTFGGVRPSDIRYVPIDTSNIVGGTAALPHQPVPTRSFSILNFFSNFSLTRWLTGPKTGTSNFPSPSAFPSTHYRSPIQPVMPINN